MKEECYLFSLSDDTLVDRQSFRWKKSIYEKHSLFFNSKTFKSLKIVLKMFVFTLRYYPTQVVENTESVSTQFK